MALETLAGIKTIDGFEVVEMDASSRQGIGPVDFVVIDHVDNSVRFRIQNGPIGEVGENGCQVDTLVEAVRLIVKGLNAKFPCRENSLAITKLEEAGHWLQARHRDRIRRGVEGTNQS